MKLRALGHYFSEAERGNFQEGTTALDWSLYWMNELALLNEPADEVSLVFGTRGQGLMANAEGSEDT